MRELRGRVAVVTGAASGIGRALALQLAEAGAPLALSDVNEAGLAEVAAAARRSGIAVLAERVDVADRAAMHAWAERVAAAHGRVNLVVNNAGVALSADVEAMRYEDLDWLMGINFHGVVHGTRAFLPHLIASGEGHVVNVSSVFGLIAVATQSAYNAAKFAVRGFTECLREEMLVSGHPVGVTCVHPGGIDTPIVANARMTAREGGPSREDAALQFKAMARTSPDAAARKILAGVRRGAPRVLIGADAWLIDRMQRWFPVRYQRWVAAAVRRGMVPG